MAEAATVEATPETAERSEGWPARILRFASKTPVHVLLIVMLYLMVFKPGFP